MDLREKLVLSTRTAFLLNAFACTQTHYVWLLFKIIKLFYWCYSFLSYKQTTIKPLQQIEEYLLAVCFFIAHRNVAIIACYSRLNNYHNVYKLSTRCLLFKYWK